MTTSKKVNITGDSNIVLSEVTADQINIGIKNDVPPQVKKAKKELACQIAHLVQIVSCMADEKEISDTQSEINLGGFVPKKFTNLIKAIKAGQCVLFIGPELSIKANKKSLHELFYNYVSQEIKEENDDSDNLEGYDANEGFFMPHSEKKITPLASLYYGGNEELCFAKDNNIGINLLTKIAQIPFKLIISLAPDDTLHRIYTKYNKRHTFLYYDETKQKLNEDKIDYPIVYNALGCAAHNGKYIYTHKQLNNYIKQASSVKFPILIEKLIKEYSHYLFLGFNFNKWHYRLLLFELNLLGEGDISAFAFKTNPIDEAYERFINRQFNIDFVDSNFQLFTNNLFKTCKKEKIIHSLDKNFVDSILKEIEKIRVKAYDSNKLEDISYLKEELITVEDKTFKYKQG